MRWTALFIVLFALSAFAEDFYVAETLQGNGGGSSAANATNKLFFNTSANWGSGAGKISAGDNVYWVGTHTTNAVINGSGSIGSPINIVFLSGSGFTKGTWNQSGANGDAAIYGNSVSNIVISGKRDLSNPDIQCTANGSGLTTSNQSVGVWFDSAQDVTVQFMTITNMYRRTPNAYEDNEIGGCIQFRTTTYGAVVIRSNICSEANVAILVSGTGNTTISDNIVSKVGEAGIIIGPPGATTMNTVLIYRNYMTQDPSWSGHPNIHLNCMHLYAFAADNQVAGLEVYANTFAGPMGSNATSMLFLEGRLISPKVYNNLFTPQSALYGGNGYLTLKGASNCFVANNTFIGFTGTPVGTAIGTTEYGTAGTSWDSAIVITNNYVTNIATMIANAANSIAASDYNVFTPDSGSAFHGFRTLAQWRSAFGFDLNSRIAVAALDANYVPTAADTALKDLGRTISWRTTDKLGTAVPQGSAPDVGAFELVQSATPFPATVAPGGPKKRGGF